MHELGLSLHVMNRLMREEAACITLKTLLDNLNHVRILSLKAKKLIKLKPISFYQCTFALPSEPSHFFRELIYKILSQTSYSVT